VLLDGPIAPMLCSPGREIPAGDGWVLEPKWDGIRAIAHVTGHRAAPVHPPRPWPPPPLPAGRVPEAL
jgi:hypothetical protein